MSLNFDMLATTGLGCIIALIGQSIVRHNKFLREWAIPAPVASGLILSIILAILKVSISLDITWDKSLANYLMNIFFTCMGFSFSFKNLSKGRKYIAPIFITITAIVIIQGTIGILVSQHFGIHPLIGVNATTGAHAGGPGTAAAFGEMYTSFGAIGATEAGVASATVGLALGSLTGGPAASYLIRKFSLKADKADEIHTDQAKDPTILNTRRFFNMVCLITIIGMFGIPIQFLLKLIPMIEVPYFIGMLFSGAIARNLMEALKVPFFEEEIDMIESVSLSIFLAVTIMTLDLTIILNLIGPIALMILLDLIITVGFGMTLCYKMYGSDYDSAVMVAGFIGTSMGSGTNAIANQQSVMDQFGYAHKAWIIFPALSVIAVDIANPLYMSLIVELFK